MMVQRIAADDTRGDTEEAWTEAETLFATLTDGEVADPALAMPDLLYRLFHEQGVRMEPPKTLDDRCTCNRERLVETLRSMSDDALHDLVEADGTLAVDCQFCNRHYAIPIGDVTGKPN